MKNPEKLLDLLSQDARLSTAQLAAMTGATEEEVAEAVRHFEKAADARRLGDFYAVGEHLLVVYHDIMTSLLSFSEGSYSTP